jgi:hypothetical protein
MASNRARRTSNDNASWAVIAALTACVAAIELASPLALALASLAKLALACGMLGAAAIFYRRVRFNERFSACCIGLAQALVFSAAGSILSYLLARNGGALWDATLQGWDRALGVDWLAYVRAIDTHGWAALPFRFGYESLILQTIAVILALGFSGKLDRLRMFILAAILSGTAAVLASPLFPAVGNFAYLGLRPGHFSHVWQSSGLADVRDFLALRHGTMATLDLRTMQGIIVFPSYHGALATVNLWAFWTSGLRWLRWVGASTALTTIAATPVFGGHYFVDVLAGIVIASVSIAAARRLVFVRVPFPAITALPFRRSHGAFAR